MSNIGRSHTIDVMKGIAMIFVVSDHAGYALHPIIDHIEVPIFFIISGFLFHGNKDFSQFLKDKIKGLVIPYIIFTLLFLGPYLMNYPECSMSGHIFNFMCLPANYPLWFLKALFWTLILYYFLNKTFSNVGIGIELSANAGIALIAIFINFEGMSSFLLLTGLPQAFQAIPLFGCGHIMARWIRENPKYLVVAKNRLLIIVIGILTCILSFITSIEGIGLHRCYIGENTLLYYPSVLFCALAFFILCKSLSFMIPLRYIGLNSISFFGFHAIALFVLTEILEMSQWILPFAAILITCPVAEIWRRSSQYLNAFLDKRHSSIRINA